ncbi:protein-disulfide reductase DsbD family protein [Chitinophaga sp. GCM10012297]|uniref:Thioredoxin family protein n=1 Tax=Chitinophaga chungangae TaxID=2821488 RepID=A0ABS3YCI7_9BACT|nr:cytochrome c biogenesis protein CcdA [Chitinophaga chungangae]MBO9152371.1 thioredoxin family protein [Chitinophaga chungangae]
MKNVLTLMAALFLLARPMAQAQDADSIPKHLNWEFKAEKKGEKEYTLHFTGKIDAGWKILSVAMGDDELNTRIVFDSLANTRAKIVTLTENPAPQEGYDSLLESSVKYHQNDVEILATIRFNDSVKDLRGTVSAWIADNAEVFQEDAQFTFSADASGNLTGEQGWFKTNTAAANELKRPAIDMQNPVVKAGGILGDGNAWLMFVFGLIGGLVALFTPCVFPMIPLTVSFFTKSAQDKKKGVFNASMYGFFIFLIYVLFSLPFHAVGLVDSAIFNNISTNVWMNLIFFTIFVVFALSFFGLFEITLPSSFASKADSKANRGNLIGIFFMALTLVIVSFSCTGPLLGSLLSGASVSGDGQAPILLTAGMAGFGVSLGLPFALFAMFPGWLSSLPKSGGWLGSVKVVLGFVELALAIKFLSNADLVTHWGILHRETFFLIWIIIGILTTLYIFGVYRFPHDSPVKKLTPVRIVFGLLFGLFTLYLIPGLTNTKYSRLKLMSGIAPPLSYSWYGKDAANKGAVEPDVINDYEKALALAKEQNKPILIDFTGWACVNCRNMEENVWTDPEVHALIKDNYILVSLYTDDRKKLPEDQQFKYVGPNGKSKDIVTIGDKYATMQTVNFSNQSQPLYALITYDEQLLTLPVGYTPSIVEYANWLKAGIEGWNKVKKQ